MHELLFIKKSLFIRSEHKGTRAIDAGEKSIGEIPHANPFIHGLTPDS
jgi:hypothetical protein